MIIELVIVTYVYSFFLFKKICWTRYLDKKIKLFLVWGWEISFILNTLNKRVVNFSFYQQRKL